MINKVKIKLKSYISVDNFMIVHRHNLFNGHEINNVILHGDYLSHKTLWIKHKF